jgi:hypothetical protein
MAETDETQFLALRIAWGFHNEEAVYVEKPQSLERERERVLARE